jgi:hypothetical protein
VIKMPSRDAVIAAGSALTLLHRVERETSATCRDDGPESQGWLLIARRHPDDPA